MATVTAGPFKNSDAPLLWDVNLGGFLAFWICPFVTKFMFDIVDFRTVDLIIGADCNISKKCNCIRDLVYSELCILCNRRQEFTFYSLSLSRDFTRRFGSFEAIISPDCSISLLSLPSSAAIFSSSLTYSQWHVHVSRANEEPISLKCWDLEMLQCRSVVIIKVCWRTLW